MFTFLSRALLIITPFLYMVFIWLQSSYFNPESVAEMTTKIDMKVILAIGIGFELTHLFMFGLLYLFIILAFLSNGKIKKWHNLAAVLIAILYSAVDEIHQIYVPFRSFSIVDLIKDGIGIMVFWWLVQKTYFGNRDSYIGKLLTKISQLANKDKKRNSSNI